MFLVSSISSQNNDEIIDTLIQFYNATNGQHWTHPWNLQMIEQGMYCNNQYGISCQNNMITHIPKSISNITSLIHLDLSFNTITSTIPNTICQLNNLNYITLSNNQLISTIPECITTLLFLTYLSLDHQLNLHGPIPGKFDQLSTLQHLNINTNHLNGTIPLSICTLHNLQYLDFGSNSFIGSIPNCIGNLSELQSLSFSKNNVNSTIPSSIFSLKSLTYLNLEVNQLSGTMPDIGVSSLESFSNLTQLDLKQRELKFFNNDNEIIGTTFRNIRVGDNIEYYLLIRVGSAVPHKMSIVDFSSNE